MDRFPSPAPRSPALIQAPQKNNPSWLRSLFFVCRPINNIVEIFKNRYILDFNSIQKTGMRAQSARLPFRCLRVDPPADSISVVAATGDANAFAEAEAEDESGDRDALLEQHGVRRATRAARTRWEEAHGKRSPPMPTLLRSSRVSAGGRATRRALRPRRGSSRRASATRRNARRPARRRPPARVRTPRTARCRWCSATRCSRRRRPLSFSSCIRRPRTLRTALAHTRSPRRPPPPARFATRSSSRLASRASWPSAIRPVL